MFGFGFNKAKVSNNAEKFIKQGKLNNAIAEYERIAKEDPKDLTILNTIGDLYARIGATDKATEYFRRIGDAYAADGFTVKAIAMYKKLTKQDPQASGAILKLAEFYTQQGLYNDARQQYTIISEQYLRSGETAKAADIFARMVEIDPESTSLQARLAELYIKLERTAEARDLYFRSAEILRSKGALQPADAALAQVLTLDPTFSKALLLRGLIQLDSDDTQSAVKSLEQVADLDSRPEGLRALLKGLIKLQRLPEADPIARKLMTMFDDPAGVLAYAEALIANGSCDAAIRVFADFSDRMLAWNSGAVINTLHNVIAKVKSDALQLESLRNLFQKAGDTTHLTEVTELLAHACVQAGDFARARDLYKNLAQMEPSNKQHLEHYQQIAAKLGDGQGEHLEGSGDSDALTLQTGDELPLPLPNVTYSTEVANEIKAALTEAELYEGYHLPERAITPLEVVLRIAPRDPQVNHRLAILYSGMGRADEAAAHCDMVSAAYADAGRERESRHFSDIARAYRQQSGYASGAEKEFGRDTDGETTGGESSVTEHQFDKGTNSPGDGGPLFFDLESPTQHEPSAISAVTSNTVADSASPAAPEAADVSSQPLAAPEKYASEFEIDSPLAASFTALPAADTAVTEFTVGGYEPSASSAALAPKQVAAASDSVAHELTFSSSEWDDLFSFDEQRLAEPSVANDLHSSDGEPTEAQSVDPKSVEPVTEIDDAAVALLDEARFYLSQSMVAEAESAIQHYEAAAPASPEMAELRSQLASLKFGHQEREIPELELLVLPQDVAAGPELNVDFDSVAAVPLAQPVIPASTATAALLGLDASGDSLLELDPEPEQSSPVVPVPATAPLALDAGLGEALNFGLSDVFAEFKRDMERPEGAATSDDLDTHYNLGVAFREMGLMDEAIGEMQKVCQAIERGEHFAQPMQAFTWLADSFVQKGVPEAGIRWYEKALKLPQINEENSIAIHYELGCAYEHSGDRPAALAHFMEVYGTNIDYREVAVRIKGLKS